MLKFRTDEAVLRSELRRLFRWLKEREVTALITAERGDGTLTRHRSNCQMNFAGKTIVGDWQDGRVYELDLDTFDDDGAAILSQRVCQHITNDGKYVFNAALELFMQTGVGTVTGQGVDPQARLRWSDDGGYSWSNEHWAAIGALGNRKTRVKWRRLGASRDRIYEVSITDPIRRVFTGAQLTSAGGTV